MSGESSTERRQDYVPVAFVELIERRIESHQSVVAAQIKELSERELTRYEEVLREIQENRIHSDKRHDETNKRLEALMASISAWESRMPRYTQPCQDIQEMKTAFPADDLGRPDYNGHRLSHKDAVEDAKATRKMMQQVLIAVASAAALSVGAWVYFNLKASAIQHITAEQQRMQGGATR